MICELCDMCDVCELCASSQANGGEPDVPVYVTDTERSVSQYTTLQTVMLIRHTHNKIDLYFYTLLRVHHTVCIHVLYEGL